MKKFKCRVCQSNGKIVINIGKQPLANAIKVNNKKEKKYDLILFQCNKCHTLQLSKDINPKILFSNYVWVTGTSDSTIRYLKDFSAYIFKKMKYNPNLRVLEIASNDGYLLQYFKEKNINVLGIEPTSSTAKAAKERGINTIENFFGVTLAEELRNSGNKADLLLGNNVLAHVPDINDFVKGLQILLNK